MAKTATCETAANGKDVDMTAASKTSACRSATNGTDADGTDTDVTG